MEPLTPFASWILVAIFMFAGIGLAWTLSFLAQLPEMLRLRRAARRVSLGTVDQLVAQAERRRRGDL